MSLAVDNPILSNPFEVPKEYWIYAEGQPKRLYREYQELNTCSRNTVTNDLRKLIQKGIIKESGKKGAGAFYVIA